MQCQDESCDGQINEKSSTYIRAGYCYNPAYACNKCRLLHINWSEMARAENGRGERLFFIDSEIVMK